MTSSAEDYQKKTKDEKKKETKLRIITNHFYLFFSHLVITTRPVEILSHYSGLSLAVSLIHKMTKDKKRGGGTAGHLGMRLFSKKENDRKIHLRNISKKKKKEDNQMNYIRQYDFFLSNSPKKQNTLP